MITIEVDQAVSKLRATFSHISAGELDRITAVALNAAMRAARNQGAKEISKIFNIADLSMVTSKVRAKSANAGNLTTYLSADRLGIQLAKFAPTQSIEDKGRMQVEVRRGKRETLRSAFWANANAGKGNALQSIFARGQYEGKEFAFRTKRVKPTGPDTPIGLLRTTSPFNMLTDREVQAKMEAVAQERFEIRFRQEVNKLLSGGSGSV